MRVAERGAEGGTPGGTIPPASVSAPVDAVAVDKGSRSNVDANQIVHFIDRPPGVTGVTNPAAITNGRDKERDESFRARLKAYVQALSRATPTALQSFVASVVLADGRRVLFSRVVEPVPPSGEVLLYIDDGTGLTDEYVDTYVSSDDVIMVSATGGETELYSSLRPIRDFISLSINGVPQTLGADFVINLALGKVILTTGLAALDTVTMRYRAYDGLIREAQRVIDGDPSSPLRYPGVRSAGIYVRIRPAQAVYQTLTGTISVSGGYDVLTVSNRVRTQIQRYINQLNIGEAVIVSEIIEQAMSVPGMYNFRITNLSGSSPPADQNILPTQVARIVSGDITLI